MKIIFAISEPFSALNFLLGLCLLCANFILFTNHGRGLKENLKNRLNLYSLLMIFAQLGLSITDFLDELHDEKVMSINIGGTLSSAFFFLFYILYIRRRSNPVLSDKYRLLISQYCYIAAFLIFSCHLGLIYMLITRSDPNSFENQLFAYLIVVSIVSLDIIYFFQFRAAEKRTRGKGRSVLNLIGQYSLYLLYAEITAGICSGLAYCFPDHSEWNLMILQLVGFGMNVMNYFIYQMRRQLFLCQQVAYQPEEQEETLVESKDSEKIMFLPGYLQFDVSEFEFLEAIGSGAFGTVYKVKVKGKIIIGKKLGETAQQVSQKKKNLFNQEIAFMNLLKDEKYIAKLIGYCSDPMCILMKYYRKGCLDDYLKKHSLSRLMRLSLLKMISIGIQSMHCNLVAHCDLKPQNILLDKDSGGLFPVLTDFGISQVISEKILALKHFKYQQLNGLSAHYAAPEAWDRIKNRPTLYCAEYYKAGDVYSLAVILFEIYFHLKPWLNDSDEWNNETTFANQLNTLDMENMPTIANDVI